MQKAVLQCRPGLIWVLLFFAAWGSRGDTLNFSNTNYIAINDSQNPPTIATPYPSGITVSNLNGEVITHLAVTLSGFTHSFPSDVNIMLEGPQGQTALLMSDVGGQDSSDGVTNLTLVLDDGAEFAMPILDPLVSGTFQPTASSTPLFFDLPAPAPPGNSNSPPVLSIFNGTDPDGTWRLFVVDDVSGDDGYIANGWSLSVSAGVPLSIASAGTNVVLSWPAVSGHAYSVQYAPSMTTVTWSNLPVTPVELAGHFFVTNARPGNIGVFRLIGN